MWICLTDDEYCDTVRRTLADYAPDAKAIFVDSAVELRAWARDVAPGAHVAVGPLGAGESSLNVAAGIVRDKKASEVVIVALGPDADVERRARLLGADAVLDASPYMSGSGDGLGVLDEPDLAGDEIPTLVMDPYSPELRDALRSVPSPEVPQGTPEQVMPPKRERTTRRAKPSGTSPHRAPVLVFVSGRGGVGKTSIIATMAAAAASWGMQVSACDLDLSCGNLYSCFGMDGPVDLGSVVLERPATPQELLACGRPGLDGVRVWGPCERPEMADAVHPQVEALIDALADESDLVLVDTCTACTDAVAQAAQQCDRLVLVVDGRPGSTVAQARLGGLAVRLGVARTRIVRLANRCGRRSKGGPQINRAEVGLETARPLDVLEGGPEVSDCLGEGKVKDLLDIGSRFAESSATALAKMLSELGRLPDVPQARRYLEQQRQRSLWSFGRMREAV